MSGLYIRGSCKPSYYRQAVKNVESLREGEPERLL
jgi:hypothetical protein